METRDLIILRHFLKRLESSYRDSEKLQTPIAPSFLKLLSREELITILVEMFGSEAELTELYPDYKEVSNEILLFSYINDEYYILHYYLEQVLSQFILK